MPYVVCNDTQYVGVVDGKARAVDSIEMAKAFESESEGRTFLKTLPMFFKNNNFRVSKTKVVPSSNSDKDVSSFVERKEAECFYLLDNIESVTANFSEMVSIIRMNREFANQQCSVCDRQKTDIEHKIELCRFDASSGYKLAKMLQEVLQKRRKYKDFIFIADTFLNSCSSIHQSQNALNAIRSMEKREYSPRELSELFQK